MNASLLSEIREQVATITKYANATGFFKGYYEKDFERAVNKLNVLVRNEAEGE